MQWPARKDGDALMDDALRTMLRLRPSADLSVRQTINFKVGQLQNVGALMRATAYGGRTYSTEDTERIAALITRLCVELADDITTLEKGGPS